MTRSLTRYHSRRPLVVRHWSTTGRPLVDTSRKTLVDTLAETLTEVEAETLNDTLVDV